ncbi:MAG: hypothetical protein M0Z85_12875 [Gammaproteobacteria bacterium]|nr:hypothetical protein [Gammaproteobacteria bacterium]
MAEQSEKFVEVRVVTTSGVYPESGFDRVQEKELVSRLLKKTDEKLHITSTIGWVAVVAGRKIMIERSFAENGLNGRVEIDWGPDHGAGGNA